MITIENWLEKDLCDFLEKEFLYNTPHQYGQKSDHADHDTPNLFYFTNLNPNDPLVRFLSYKLKKTVSNDLILNDIYINVQHPNMDGDFHVDPGTMTALYMVTGSGDFEIKNEKKIKFKKNKLICFDAKKFHRGIAPKEGVRITLAFKTTKTENKYDR